MRAEIIDVTPRDGLQTEAALVSTDQKIQLIEQLIDVGARRIEATSFVHPRRVPQMADADDVMAAVPRDRGVSYIGLVLNERGADRAIAAEVDELNFVVPMTETFAAKNQNTTVAKSIEAAKYAATAAAAARIPICVTLAVAFGCPYEGDVEGEAVLRAVGSLTQDVRIDEIALADTIGCATPGQAARLFAQVGEATDSPLRAHFHETRHTALANTAAALAVGVRRFDSSVGGLGGCPFAPGAAGNISTEDLAWFLDREGWRQNIDAVAATESGRWISSVVGVTPRSGLAGAGYFPSSRSS